VLPPSAREFCTEHVVTLPDVFQANDRARRSDPTPARADAGLPADAFVFAAFNSAHKLSPVMFDIWMRLLGRCPGSVLWLTAGTAVIEANLRREAQARGIGSPRLVFAPRLRYPAYLARLPLADLFLDTFPFNAGATASDALWMGLPVLTCAGRAFASRMAGSLVRAVGLPELATTSLADYEALGMALARDPARLAALRQTLAANVRTQPLFDTGRFTRHLEAAYVAMWERAQRGERPAPISVPRLA
jgi:predicted O-linked N-acetylglucosamine transferase (SPINDLY family)